MRWQGKESPESRVISPWRRIPSRDGILTGEICSLCGGHMGAILRDDRLSCVVSRLVCLDGSLL
jgi:hypothetical protein